MASECDSPGVDVLPFFPKVCGASSTHCYTHCLFKGELPDVRIQAVMQD